MTRCRNVTLPDGTTVRVQGDRPLTDEQLHQLQEIVTDVRARWDNECHALSAVPLPETAQRLHGRDTYWCGRHRGHDGPHRWPADTTRPAVAEWTSDVDELARARALSCLTCNGWNPVAGARMRTTAGLVCQTCGWDYGKGEPR